MVLRKCRPPLEKRCLRPIHEASLPFPSSYKFHIRAKNCFVAGFFVIALRPATHFDSGEIPLFSQSRVWALVTFFDGGNTYLVSRNKATLDINSLFIITICLLQSNVGSSVGLARR